MNGLEAVALMQARGMMLSWNRPTSGDWAKVLATFPLFSGVSERRLRRLVRAATFAEYAVGETILARGERSDSLYVILGGVAKQLRNRSARILRTGDYFGELASIDGVPRSATVAATQELHVMRLPAHSVLRLARRHPAMTVTLLRNLNTHLRRLETTLSS
jgi:CRP/FNR family transcriptional regulator, cyclic AMP receptor protein